MDLHKRFALAAFFAVSGPHLAHSQQSLTYASLAGRVMDPMHALLPHGTVVAFARNTGQVTTAATDAAGRFQLPFLPPGPYRVTAAAAGFGSVTREVELTVGSAFDLELELPLASARNTVEVTAATAALESDRSQIAETVRSQEIEALPFNGRNYLDLALLLPGVSPTNTNSTQTFAETSPVLGQGYSINSQRNFSNSFVVDGLSANDDAAGLAGNSYSFDVVREFQVVTSGGQAEFGRALGGYINIATRSGSNDLHGTVYGFLRNQRLNAQNPLSHTLLPQTQGQFGVSLSGPLRRNRTFLFGNYEGRRLNTNGIVTIAPGSAAAINARLNALGFTGPRLQVSNGPATLYPTTVHTDNGFLRADQRFRNGDQLSLRYSVYRLNSNNARGVGGLADVSDGTAVQDLNHTIAVSNVATVSPRLFIETRGQFTFDSLNAPPNTEASPAVTISGVATFGALFFFAHGAAQSQRGSGRQRGVPTRRAYSKNRCGLPLQQRHDYVSADHPRVVHLCLARGLSDWNLHQRRLHTELRDALASPGQPEPRGVRTGRVEDCSLLHAERRPALRSPVSEHDHHGQEQCVAPGGLCVVTGRGQGHRGPRQFWSLLRSCAAACAGQRPAFCRQTQRIRCRAGC